MQRIALALLGLSLFAGNALAGDIVINKKDGTSITIHSNGTTVVDKPRSGKTIITGPHGTTIDEDYRPPAPVVHQTMQVQVQQSNIIYVPNIPTVTYQVELQPTLKVRSADIHGKYFVDTKGVRWNILGDDSVFLRGGQALYGTIDEIPNEYGYLVPRFEMVVKNGNRLRTVTYVDP